MHQELGVGELGAALLEGLTRQRRVDVTLPQPHVDVTTGDPLDVLPEEEIRQEQDRHTRRQRGDDGHGVSRGAAVVRLGLDVCRRVDVGHDEAVRMLGAPGAHVGGLNRGGERAPGVRIGDQHAFPGIRDRRGLRHEVHAANDEQRRVELSGAPGHLQRVGQDIGQVLDFRPLIVVRENRGVPLGFEGTDFRDQIMRVSGSHRPNLPAPIGCGTAAGGPVGQRLSPPQMADRSQRGCELRNT